MSRNWLLFLLFFLISASFRLTNMGYMEFKTDEAINLLLSLRPLFGHALTPGGTVSSLGVLNPPFFNYFLLPIAFINNDPKFVAFIIALINTLSVPFFFLIIKKYYNERIAFISSALIALSPWAIIYSRKIWMQDLLIPFFIGLFLCIHKLKIEKKYFYWLPYSFLCLILVQLHPVSLIFIGTITLFLIHNTKINTKFILTGLIVGFISLIPYLSYEIKNSCPDCSNLIQARSRLDTKRSLELFERPLQIASQGDFRFVLGNDTLTLETRFPLLGALKKFFYLEYILIPLSLFVFFKKYKNLRFLIYGFLLLPIIYYILKIEPFMHYYIIVMPLIFLFMGVLFDNYMSNKNFFVSNLALVYFSILLFVSIYYNYSLFNILISNNHLAGDYGSSYFKTEKNVKEQIKQFEGNPEYEEIFLSSFIPLGYTYGYMPLGKILYGQVSEKRAKELDKQLMNNTQDPRVIQELFTYYTKEKTDIKLLDKLRIKSTDTKAYAPIYQEVLRDYLYQNHKKEFLSSVFGIRFFYPEHWSANQEKDKIVLEGDGKKFFINTSSKPMGNLLFDEIAKTIRPL